jgi:hypothetical protein
MVSWSQLTLAVLIAYVVGFLSFFSLVIWSGKSGLAAFLKAVHTRNPELYHSVCDTDPLDIVNNLQEILNAQKDSYPREESSQAPGQAGSGSQVESSQAGEEVSSEQVK